VIESTRWSSLPPSWKVRFLSFVGVALLNLAGYLITSRLLFLGFALLSVGVMLWLAAGMPHKGRLVSLTSLALSLYAFGVVSISLVLSREELLGMGYLLGGFALVLWVCLQMMFQEAKFRN
jgi:hypothetical protein